MLLCACSVAGALCAMVEGVSQDSCSPFQWAGLMYPLPSLMDAWHSWKGWVRGQSHAGQLAAQCLCWWPECSPLPRWA